MPDNMKTPLPRIKRSRKSRPELAIDEKRSRLRELERRAGSPAPAAPDEIPSLRPAAHKNNKWAIRLAATTGVLLVAAVCLGKYGWTVRAERGNAYAELTRAHTDSSTCAADLSILTRSHAATRHTLGQCAAARSRLGASQVASATTMASVTKDLAATKQELEELRKQRAETAKRLAAFKTITARFRKMIDSGRLNVEIRNGRMVVKLPAGVLFSSGSADLSRPGELALMEVAIILRGFPKRRFMIVGHTDNRPLEASDKSQYKDNWDLSTARAVRVTRFMMEAKLNPKNLLAAGHGEFDPVADNRTRPGRQSNRRIEIILLPNIEELPTPPTPLTADQGKRS